jgi:hypothetical protein
MHTLLFFLEVNWVSDSWLELGASPFTHVSTPSSSRACTSEVVLWPPGFSWMMSKG